MDDELIEFGSVINRYFGGITGSARGPNVLFGSTQTIRGHWESSSELVFTATSSDKDQENYWRGATYDDFDGNTWAHSQASATLVDAKDDILGPTAETVVTSDPSRHLIQVEVTPSDYGGDVIVAPDAPVNSTQQLQVQTNGEAGPFVEAKLVAGIQPNVPFAVQSSVRDQHGADVLTANELAAAGTDYPDWVRQYLSIRPGSIGVLTDQIRDQIVNGLPVNQRDPYHLAFATQYFLNKGGHFQYVTDVRGMCSNTQLVDCFLQTRQGYCEYFATAMTMLLRDMGVPARYVLGYLPGQQQDDGTWRVERGAAHAWVEVYFPKYGWVQFDPTPGNTENGQHITQLPAGAAVDQPVATIRPNPEDRDNDPFACVNRPDDPLCANGLGTAADPGGNAAGITDTTLTSVLVAAAIIVILALLALWATWRRVPKTEPELAYRGVTTLATRLGYGPRPSQTVYEYAAGLGELVPVAQEDLQVIATAKVEATYGRRQPADTMRLRLGQAYRRVRIGLLRLVMRRPHFNLRPRSVRIKR